MISAIVRVHRAVFYVIERALTGWFPGLAARLIFASVLLVYFLNSAMTKIGSGPLGFVEPTVGAYAQILPKMMEQAGYDVSQIAFVPYGLIVIAGTWAEFLLPVLIVAGLFTRLASLGMIGFVFVMTYVDITGHNVEASTIGAFFDRIPDSVIADQRLMWLFPLIYLVLYGPGLVSLDALFARRALRSRPW